MAIEVRPTTLADIEAVRRLVKNHPYAQYRAYRLFNHDFASDHLQHVVERYLEAGGQVSYLALRSGKVVGFSGAVRSDWESRHFGIEMSAIPYLFAEGEGKARGEIQEALLGATVAGARDREIDHLAAKVDLEDLTGLAAAERQGFHLVDTLATYVDIAAKTPAVRPKPHPIFELATYEKEQFPQLAPEEMKPLENFMREAYRVDRFHMDHRLPAERSHEVYVEWFRNILSGEWADLIHVARVDGKVVGFLGLQYFRELEERYGVKVPGHGLSAVLPLVRGGYSAVVGLALANTPHDFGEFDTQIQNFLVINIWIKHGLAFLRGRYTLHRWLDA